MGTETLPKRSLGPLNHRRQCPRTPSFPNRWLPRIPPPLLSPGKASRAVLLFGGGVTFSFKGFETSKRAIFLEAVANTLAADDRPRNVPSESPKRATPSDPLRVSSPVCPGPGLCSRDSPSLRPLDRGRGGEACSFGWGPTAGGSGVPVRPRGGLLFLPRRDYFRGGVGSGGAHGMAAAAARLR